MRILLIVHGFHPPPPAEPRFTLTILALALVRGGRPSPGATGDADARYSS